MNSGPEAGAGADQRVERDHAARLVPHEEEPELLRVLPELRLGLQVHLVDAAELVEVVDVGAAEQRAERGVDVVQQHARLEHLAAIDVGEHLRHARAVQRADASDLRPLARRLDEALRLLGEVLRRAAAAILQLHREPGAGAETRNRGRPEGEHLPFRDLLRERPVQRVDDFPGVRLGGCAAPPTA